MGGATPQLLSILENFEVNGTVPITQSQIADMFNSFQQNVLTMIQNNNNNNQQQQTEPATSAFSSWTWGGRIHPVPADFVLPKCNLKAIWDLWWCGNPAKQYAPYSRLKGFDLCNKKDRVNLSKLSMVMKALTGDDISSVEISRMSVQIRDATFDRLFMNLFHKLFPQQANDDFDARRFGDQSYLTIYNYLSNDDDN
jgi:hypothetical protein